MARFHLTIVRPQGYRHSDCFHEVAETMFHALRRLGHDVTLQENSIEPGATTILFGAHLLHRMQALALPASVVVYNLEQLGGAIIPTWYMDLAAKVQIWEYTPLNLARWSRVPCVAPPRLVEIGYVAELSRIVSAPLQDIDVLFYGSVTPRRKSVLDALAATGLRMCAANGVYGAERDALIARSRVVLNLHAREQRIFEMVRVSYLLANAKAVVVEESEDMGALADAVAACTYDGLIETCVRLVGDEAERRALEVRALDVFAKRTQMDILAAAGL